MPRPCRRYHPRLQYHRRGAFWGESSLFYSVSAPNPGNPPAAGPAGEGTAGASAAGPAHPQAAAASALPQSATCVLLVRPAAFGYNEETAATNQFQQRPAAQRRTVARDGGGGTAATGEGGHGASLQARALGEFDALCAALQAAGVRLCIAPDTAEPPRPDAVFPNNWVSWHHDGSVVLYPMQAKSRRAERRPELLAAAEAQAGFRRRRLIDLSAHEREGRYLEGTGSLVLDHRRRIAYVCRSARSDADLAAEWGRLLDYEPLVFDARAPDGSAPYHTNVMLAIGTHWAIVCTQAIVPADRARVLGSLAASGRSIVQIPVEAMQRFAGNVLELEVRAGAGAGVARSAGRRERRILALSASAAAALRGQAQGAWPTLQAGVDEIVAVDVSCIEQAGGGSVRCMLAEIFGT